MITHLDIDTLRALIERGNAWPSVPATRLDVGPALELACAFAEWSDSNSLSREADAWASKSDVMVDALHALGGGVSDVAENETPVREFWPLGSRAALEHARATFILRFRRSLRNRAGLSGNAALAVAMAAFEMADNTIQHSGPDIDHPAAGALGFEVNPGRICFAIVDRGRGVFQSLASSERWNQIASARDALEAAVIRHASRRENGVGGGFRDLAASLAELSGTLRFGTEDAVLQLDGQNQALRQRRRQTRPFLRGFQISVEMRTA